LGLQQEKEAEHDALVTLQQDVGKLSAWRGLPMTAQCLAARFGVLEVPLTDVFCWSNARGDTTLVCFCVAGFAETGTAVAVVI